VTFLVLSFDLLLPATETMVDDDTSPLQLGTLGSASTRGLSHRRLRDPIERNGSL
jgi:hypothetical protein